MASERFNDDTFDHDGDDASLSLNAYHLLGDDEQHLRLLALTDINQKADELISRLQSERPPDTVHHGFYFDASALALDTLATPRYLDVLTDTQYDLAALHLTMTHSETSHPEDVGICLTFELKPKTATGGEVHTLIAKRDGLRTPSDALADEFTYPASPHMPHEETIRFPTMSSNELRVMIAQLLPPDEATKYAFHSDYIQNPDLFASITELLSKQTDDYDATASYQFFDHTTGDFRGKFTYSQAETTMTEFSLALPGDNAQTQIIYDFNSGYVVRNDRTEEIDEQYDGIMTSSRYDPLTDTETDRQPVRLAEMITVLEFITAELAARDQHETEYYDPMRDVTDTGTFGTLDIDDN